MERNSVLYQQYTGILREELVPAMGCTEPISIAYAAAKCRALLGCEPERCVLEVSSSIIKNVKSVIVPNTGGRKGIETAVAAGIVGGDAGTGNYRPSDEIARSEACVIFTRIAATEYRAK